MSKNILLIVIAVIAVAWAAYYISQKYAEVSEKLLAVELQKNELIERQQKMDALRLTMKQHSRVVFRGFLPQG